ncbi:fimbrial protein [Serratia fonticola]|jgi:type 1 fimbria pilin|uniref:fimbrial protein n=1 Tax=Serratia fonticola TaxID=47917 RepID=UPI0021783D31|nr:fimbrial protein [Serratia fonticola]CAI1663399.1 Major MR/P fimbria protein precursor [Serratia fonticola]
MNKRRTWPWAIALTALLSIGECGAAESLELKFKGSLHERICSFEQGEQVQEVNLQLQSVKYFEHYGRTANNPFLVSLTNCSPPTLAKMVQLTFNGAHTQVVEGETLLATEGDTGLVLGLTDGKGQAIKLGEAVSAGQITHIGEGALNQFQFGVYARAVGAVKAGNYSSTVTIGMAFE